MGVSGIFNAGHSWRSGHLIGCYICLLHCKYYVSFFCDQCCRFVSHSPVLIGQLVHVPGHVILSFTLVQSSFYYSRLPQSRLDSNCPFFTIEGNNFIRISFRDAVSVLELQCWL